jgi:hypothetical protein
MADEKIKEQLIQHVKQCRNCRNEMKFCHEVTNNEDFRQISRSGPEIIKQIIKAFPEPPNRTQALLHDRHEPSTSGNNQPDNKGEKLEPKLGNRIQPKSSKKRKGREANEKPPSPSSENKVYKGYKKGQLLVVLNSGEPSTRISTSSHTYKGSYGKEHILEENGTGGKETKLRTLVKVKRCCQSCRKDNLIVNATSNTKLPNLT